MIPLVRTTATRARHSGLVKFSDFAWPETHVNQKINTIISPHITSIKQNFGLLQSLSFASFLDFENAEVLALRSVMVSLSSGIVILVIFPKSLTL